MNNYQPIVIAARNLHATEETLLEFQRSGWIDVVAKNGQLFVSGHDLYRGRFILHLRDKLGLTNEEISLVLVSEKPPYSLERVQAILAQRAAGQ